jgi:hypothetical protein
MAQFKAFDTNVEINGRTVMSVIDGMGSMTSSRQKAMEILRRHGIKHLHKSGWYNQQDWLDSIQEIAQTFGSRTLYLIGKRIPKNAKFPPQINNLKSALKAIDVAYHQNHRGGEIGSYSLESFGEEERMAFMKCTNPYPCDFDRGIIDQQCQQFKPVGVKHIRVEHDPNSPCRKEGAESCTYHIRW